ncbi:nuclear pore complex protein NUP1-like isoform X2 [Olea europaea var. sylvestris]|uniref:nuclear pore complex protein NUP1-like isoform X2 n=1 Tax=Olea europaea var. sylvestris TaxID=158386 RepID=UPI000C1D2140|nr:nuclear pore complex protein NUP1-like isoform X2 [Olea europaea var. sylvestris]
MSTTGEGDAASTFSYEGGGGGAGGKFRERPFRRIEERTPYDRPVNNLRGITATTPNENSGSWLTKLVMDPASNLISFGANRFSSVFSKRLPAPPRQEPEANHELSGAFQGTVPENQSGGQEPASGNGSHLINSSVSGGISELEQLLKQKTFTRPEIEHLTELLCSKAVEGPASDDGKTIDALPKLLTDVERNQQYSSASLEKYKIEDRSHGVISTPAVLEHEIASPAELAKAYMGSRPSKLSLSRLGMRNQAVTEGSRLLSNVLFTPKSPVKSFTRKNAVNLEVLEYGSVTPRSRGRSSIYNMTRTPYSRVYPTDLHKGTGSAHNGYGGPSSSSPFAMEHYRLFGPNKLTLKRRSSMLEDDLSSVGPIRRIRQKPSLLSHRSPLSDSGVEINSDTAQISLKQKLPLEDEPRHKISKTVGGNEDKSAPSTSYTPVPAKSREIAARILQHLEKLTPKEKSSESKPSAAWDKSPLKTKPIKIQDGHKLEGCVHDSTSQKQVEVEENDPKESVGPHEKLTPAVNIDTSVLVKAFRPLVETTDSLLKTFASQPPQKRQAFEMSAHEDYLEQDDYRDSNGIAPQPLGDRRETAEVADNDGKPSPAELKLEKTTIQLEMKSPSGPLSSKISDMESSGVIIVGKESTAFASTASQVPSTSFQSTLRPQSVFNFDNPKEVNNSPSLAISSSPSELSYRKPITWLESKPESSSSSVNLLSTATGGQQIIAESNKGDDQNMQEAGCAIGKYETVSSVASNGSLVSISPAFSFTPSTSIANFMPSFTAASSSCHFGSNVEPSPVNKFGISADPSTAVSASSTSNISEPAIFQYKTEDNNIFGSLSNTSSSVSSYAVSSGSNTFGLGSSLASSTANGQSQGSFLAVASGFLTSSIGTVSQSTPIQFGTSASLSSVNISSSTLFGSSTVSSQALSQNSSFGFSSSLASASTANGIGSGNEPTSSLFKFVGSSSGVNAVSSSSGATGLSSVGASSFSSGADADGFSSGASFGVFSFSASSSASTRGINAASNSTGTFGIKFGGNSSASPMFTTNTASIVLNSSSGAASSSPAFSFSAAPAAASSPVSGNPTSPFAISSGDNNQINTEDSMASDPAKSSVPSLPVFGQPSILPSNPSQANPFQFGGQPNQLAQENQSTFQASTSLGFSSSGSFSLGSSDGGGDKSGCKIVKFNPNQHRKK